MQLKRALGLLPLALLLIAWDIAVELKVYPQILLPPPIKVLKVFVEDWPTVLDNAEASISRVVAGISLSFLVAVPLAAASAVLARFGLRRYLASPMYSGEKPAG